MSPACIAQFFGSAVSFSTSEFAHAAPMTAGNHAIANAMRTHRLSTIFVFIGPPKVMRLFSHAASKKSAEEIRTHATIFSFAPRLDKVNLICTICREHFVVSCRTSSNVHLQHGSQGAPRGLACRSRLQSCCYAELLRLDSATHLLMHRSGDHGDRANLAVGLAADQNAFGLGAPAQSGRSRAP